jgi:hypothetical protein
MRRRQLLGSSVGAAVALAALWRPTASHADDEPLPGEELAKLKITWWGLSMSGEWVHLELLNESKYYVSDMGFRLRISQGDNLLVSRCLHGWSGPNPGEPTTYKFSDIAFPDVDQSTVQSALTLERALGFRPK